MNNDPKMHINELEALFDRFQSHSSQVLNDMGNRPASMSPKQARAVMPPQNGQPLGDVFDEFLRDIDPHMCASAGPRYFGFVTGGTSPAAILGDWLTTLYDPNPQSNSAEGDVSAFIEHEAMAMLRGLLNLEDAYINGFVSGATMANFTCLAVAREWAGQQKGHDTGRDGIGPKIRILSATPHSSSVKALSMLGLGRDSVITVPTLPGREAMDCAALEKLLESDRDTPTILISSAGTVNSGDFDDMKAIAAHQKRFNFWWHVDGAFGAFAAAVPQLSHFVEGWENADSITVDGHKWLNVPYDSGFYFIKKPHAALQMNCFQNANAPYLGERLENFSYSNFGPENSRRLRALPVWFAMKTYGAEGFQALFERNIVQAQKLGTLIEASEEFEVLAPVRLNIVVFALKNEAVQKNFNTSLNATRRVFMTPTKIFGRLATRAALVNWQTRDEDIDITWAEMQRALRDVTGL